MMKEKLKLLDKLAKDYAEYDPSDPEKDFDYWLVKFDWERISLFLGGKIVCELGCSTGAMSLRIAEVVEKLVIVDGSTHNIAIVKEKLKKKFGDMIFKKVKLVRALWEEFDGSGFNFSDIIFTHGLEHVDDPIGLLSKLYSWMDCNARLHIVVPNAYSLHRRIGVLMGLLKDVHELNDRDRKTGHKRVYDREMLFRHLEKAGFKIIHWEGIYLKPLSNDQMKTWSERLIYAFFELGRELPDYCAEIYVCAIPKKSK